MHKIFIVTISLLMYFCTMAQITFDAKISDKHMRKVARAGNARAKLSSYKKFHTKDSIKAARQAWKEYKKTNKDSLRSIGKWKEAKAHQNEILLGKCELKDQEKLILDHSSFDLPEDSLDWALQELSRQGDFSEIQEVYEEYAQYDSSFLDRFKKDSVELDSLALSDRFKMKERVESYLPPELVEESKSNITQQLKTGALQPDGSLQQMDPSGVKEFLQNVPTQEFAKSQVSLEKAKRKFKELPSLEKQEDGIKRQSLKGTPLKRRFFLSGNVALQSTDPFVVDSNIQLGFRFNTKLASGIGLVLREQINNRDSLSITGAAHGCSFFVSYDITKGFFVYGEYRAVVNRSLLSELTSHSVWQHAHLIGIGRSFQISKKISLRILLLYDFHHGQNRLSTRPLVPSIGYNFSF